MGVAVLSKRCFANDRVRKTVCSPPPCSPPVWRTCFWAATRRAFHTSEFWMSGINECRSLKSLCHCSPNFSLACSGSLDAIRTWWAGSALTQTRFGKRSWLESNWPHFCAADPWSAAKCRTFAKKVWKPSSSRAPSKSWKACRASSKMESAMDWDLSASWEATVFSGTLPPERKTPRTPSWIKGLISFQSFKGVELLEPLEPLEPLGLGGACAHL